MGTGLQNCNSEAWAPETDPSHGHDHRGKYCGYPLPVTFHQDGDRRWPSRGLSPLQRRRTREDGPNLAKKEGIRTLWHKKRCAESRSPVKPRPTTKGVQCLLNNWNLPLAIRNSAPRAHRQRQRRPETAIVVHARHGRQTIGKINKDEVEARDRGRRRPVSETIRF